MMVLRAACATALVALVSIATTNLAALFAKPAPPSIEPAPVPPRMDDTRAEVPVAWESLPVVAHPRLEETKTIATEDHLFAASVTYRAPLGAVAIEWVDEVCAAGGSACAQSPREISSIRVGDPDDRGVPQLTTSVACVGTAPFLQQPQNPENRSCAIESIALRSPPDGSVYVMTFRDPDAVELPVAAFTRTMPVAPGAARRLARVVLDRDRGGAGWRLLPVLVFAFGALALRASRRHRRLLAWREERVQDAMIHVEGKPIRVMLDREADVVLVEPESVERALASYRELPTLDARAVFPTSHGTVAVKARAAAIVALVFSAGAALGAVLVAVF